MPKLLSQGRWPLVASPPPASCRRALLCSTEDDAGSDNGSARGPHHRAPNRNKRASLAMIRHARGVSARVRVALRCCCSFASVCFRIPLPAASPQCVPCECRFCFSYSLPRLNPPPAQWRPRRRRPRPRRRRPRRRSRRPRSELDRRANPTPPTEHSPLEWARWRLLNAGMR